MKITSNSIYGCHHFRNKSHYKEYTYEKSMLLKLVSILAIFTLMLVACSDSGKETSKATKDNGSDKPKRLKSLMHMEGYCSCKSKECSCFR